MLQSLSNNVYNIVDIFLRVADCSTVPPLVVDSASATYNSVGTFSCANNGTLYYSNGTRPTSPQTICLAIAKWSGQDGLKCWKGRFIVRRENFAVSIVIFLRTMPCDLG